MKIGIIGAGRIGKVHAESVSAIKGVQIAAIADPMMNDEGRAWAAGKGIAHACTDYRDVLADDSIKAVLICSSTDTHSSISLDAIAAGKHVFCEKPIDHDVNKIKQVMAALQGSSVKYQVGFNRRFDRNFMAVRQAVAEGKIGQLNVLKICSRDPAAPPVSYIKVSGGIFLDMTIHDFDMVRYLSGDEVEEVYAMGAVLVDRAIGEAGDVDTAVVTMRLKSGAIAVIDNCRRAAYGYDQRVEAFGSLGQVSIGNETPSLAVLSNADGVTAEKPLYFFLERYMDAYRLEVSQFLQAVQNDTPTPVGVVDGLKPVLIGLAAKKSLQLGRPVPIREIEEEYGL